MTTLDITEKKKIANQNVARHRQDAESSDNQGDTRMQEWTRAVQTTSYMIPLWTDCTVIDHIHVHNYNMIDTF